MANDDSRPIIQQAPTYSPALMAALDANCFNMREVFRTAYQREAETRETVLRLKAELRTAKENLKAEKRLVKNSFKRTLHLDQNYIDRHNIDVELYEAYLPGDELDPDAVLFTADIIALHGHAKVAA